METKISISLNKEQEEAVHHIEGPLLVLAGAGSGKTRVVTQRIAHLVQIGVPASEILAVTFTNKAAEEMRLRVRNLCNQSILTSTFHSLGARILRESISALGYPSTFAIYDEDDSVELIKSCLATFNYPEEKAVVRSMRQKISASKNALTPPEAIKPPTYHDPDFAMFQSVYPLYQTKLKEYGAVDFDDLLFLPVELFQKNPDILERYQSRWSFIMIDEYQDTNPAQYLIAKMLVAKHLNLFVVGDPDQSIYSWRGASIHNILHFEKDFPGAKVVSLEQNYRSTNHILEGANALIRENEERFEKHLWSDLGDGEKIQILDASSDREEADFIVETIKKIVSRDQLPMSQVAIFYRTNSQSRVFEDAFVKARLPYIIIGGLSFYQRREIKDILSFLKMCVSDSDFLAFTRTINIPKKGLGNTTLAKLAQAMDHYKEPILVLIRKITRGEYPDIKLSAPKMAGIKEYLAGIDSIRSYIASNAPLQDLIQQTIVTMRYLEYLKEDPETFEDRKGNLEELVSKATELTLEEENMNLTLFLEQLSLRSQLDHQSSQASIQMMTLHNGKGLEFPLVFIVGMEEDLLPHVNSKDKQSSLEEERRLCYVGMTRAKKYLFLTSSRYRLMWGSPRMMEPSRFLSELPKEHIALVGKDRFTADTVLVKGTVVLHRDFGRGIIQKSYESSFGTTYDVFFPGQETTRTLVAKYAKLQVI